MIKGIILAGGLGTRMSQLLILINNYFLFMMTELVISLSILILAGVREILIIVNKDHTHFKKVILNGENLGLKIKYAEQDKPKGFLML